jgi:hypothetical protein
MLSILSKFDKYYYLLLLKPIYLKEYIKIESFQPYLGFQKQSYQN